MKSHGFSEKQRKPNCCWWRDNLGVPKSILQTVHRAERKSNRCRTLSEAVRKVEVMSAMAMGESAGGVAGVILASAVGRPAVPGAVSSPAGGVAAIARGLVEGIFAVAGAVTSSADAVAAVMVSAVGEAHVLKT